MIPEGTNLVVEFPFKFVITIYEESTVHLWQDHSRRRRVSIKSKKEEFFEKEKCQKNANILHKPFRHKTFQYYFNFFTFLGFLQGFLYD